MFTAVLVPFLVVSSGLMALLVLLLVTRRLHRDHDVRVSARRRRRYEAAFDTGSERELVQVARSARRRPAAQADLAVVLARALDRAPEATRTGFRRAVAESGLHVRLIRQLGSRSAVRRGRALLLVARLRLPEALPHLERLLADGDPDVRQAAARALALYESDAAARALIGALGREAIAPARIVEQLAHPWAVPALLKASRAAALRAVRPLLTEALGLARDRRAVPWLSDLLASSEDEERVAACRALARFSDPELRDLFMRALDDGFAPVRAQAARALGAVPDPVAAPALQRGLGDPFWWVRSNCADALRRTGPDGIAALERALQSDDRFARDRAAEALTLQAALDGAG